MLSIEPMKTEIKLLLKFRYVKFRVLSIEAVNDEFVTPLSLITDKLISG